MISSQRTAYLGASLNINMLRNALLLLALVVQVVVFTTACQPSVIDKTTPACPVADGLPCSATMPVEGETAPLKQANDFCKAHPEFEKCQ